MGTFKHIGHLRTARLIGKELASFYLCVFHFTVSIVSLLTCTVLVMQKRTESALLLCFIKCVMYVGLYRICFFQIWPEPDFNGKSGRSRSRIFHHSYNLA